MPAEVGARGALERGDSPREREAEQPVAEEAVDRAREDDDDEHAEPVDREVVVEVAEGGREQDASNSGEVDERRDRLLARLHRLIGFVLQRGENRTRALQNEEGAQPPVPL